MPISALPATPSRADPTTFSVKGDAFMAALPLFRTEANTLETNVNAKEVLINAASLAAQVDAFKGEWDDLTGAAAVPYCVYHSGEYWALLSNLADVTAKEPGVDAEWVRTDTIIIPTLKKLGKL